MTACGEPFSKLAGGELSGVTATPPALWSDVPDVVQLEVRPADPYSVNVWCVVVDNDLYIATSPEGNEWLAHIRSDGKVRLRLGETLYPLRAVEIGDAPELRTRGARSVQREVPRCRRRFRIETHAPGGGRQSGRGRLRLSIGASLVNWRSTRRSRCGAAQFKNASGAADE